VPLNSLKLNGLTTLTLHHVPVPFRQNIEELLAMLSCLQDLTQLYLDDALASSAGFLSSAAFTTLQNINLPHLFLILIVAPLSTVIAFLSGVKISSNAEFILECDSEVDSSLDNYSLLSSLLGQKFNVAENQDSSSHPIRSLVIEPFMEKLSLILTFSASERHCCVSSSRMEWGCNIPLQIALNDLTVDRERIISDICCSMPLTHLQSLHVVAPPTSSAFWMRTFGHLRDLRHIKLGQGSMPELASLLYGECTENRAGHTPNHIFAPALEELQVYEIMFAADPPTLDTLGTDLLSLQDAISTRERARLVVARC
jgi:hypothetical protein